MDFEHKGHPQKRLRPAQVKAAYHPSQLKPEQIDRHMATDDKLGFTDDAQAVLVNLTMTRWTSHAELKRLLAAKRLKKDQFDEEYLDRLLAHLLERRKIVADGDSWKRT